MTGSYLFNYDSYYNGLMTDLGLKEEKKALSRLFPILFGKVETGVGEDNLVGTIEGADSTFESLF